MKSKKDKIEGQGLITALRVSAVDSLKNLLRFAILHLKLWLQKIFDLGRKSICYEIEGLLMTKNY